MARKEPKLLKIRVVEKGKELLNITIPFALVRLASEVVPKETLDKYGLDLMRILALASDLPQGKLVDIKDPRKKVHVEITIE
jgi:hypothetical protein